MFRTSIHFCLILWRQLESLNRFWIYPVWLPHILNWLKDRKDHWRIPVICTQSIKERSVRLEIAWHIGLNLRRNKEATLRLAFNWLVRTIQRALTIILLNIYLSTYHWSVDIYDTIRSFITAFIWTRIKHKSAITFFSLGYFYHLGTSLSFYVRKSCVQAFLLRIINYLLDWLSHFPCLL